MNTFKQRLNQVLSCEDPRDLLMLAIEYSFRDTNIDESYQRMMLKLGAISRVEYSQTISTAAIGVEGSSVKLLFNRKFMYENIFSPEDLLFVVFHEIMHRVKGDVLRKTKTERERQIWNIAYDMSINTRLVWYVCPDSSRFLNNFYGKSPFPINLMAPDSAEKCTGSLASDVVDDIIKASWKGKKCSSSQMYVLFERLFDILYGPEKKPDFDIVFIGNHDEKHSGIDKWSKWLKDYAFNTRISGVGPSITDTNYTRKKEISSIKFYEIVKKALSPDCEHQILKEQLIPERGFLPFPGRKESFFLSSGFIPIIYSNPIQKKDFSEWSPVLYIDVSGSTMDYWSVIYGLIMSVKELISDRIYFFSNDIKESSVAEIKEGKVKTSYGTDYEKLFKHIDEKGHKRILIITDGMGSCSDKLKKKVLNKTKVYVIYTSSDIIDAHTSIFQDTENNDLKDKQWWYLPEFANLNI